MIMERKDERPQGEAQEVSLEDLKRYLGDRPIHLSRRDVLSLFGATVASVALTEGVGAVSASPSAASAVAAMAAQGGPSAKIVTANGLDLDELDPHYFKSIPSYFAVCNLYDNLFAYEYGPVDGPGLAPVADNEGNWKLQPWLLESWEVSPDQKSLTFQLRQDLKFSDGTPVTARDVKATWDRGVSESSVYSKLVFNLMTVMRPDQITTPDDHTVVLQLEQPTVFALKMIAVNVLDVMSAAALEAHQAPDDPTAHNYFKTNPLGSAAYVLSEWTPGVAWEFAPNPNYWNPGALKNGGVINRVVPSAQERLSLLLNGDVDLAFNLLPKDLAEVRDNPDVQLFNFTVPWPYYLGMNNRIPPFDRVEVRQAVSHAIPYQTLIDQVMFGFAQEVKSPVAAGMPTSDYSFWQYDGGTARAKEILEQAGLEDVTFDLAVLIGFPQNEQIAVWIQSALAEAGVTVNVRKMTDAEYYDNFNKGQLHAFIGEWYSWVNDPMYHLYWNFLSTNTATNATGYSNPRVDEIIKTGLYEPDLAKREALSKEAQKIIVEEAPWGLLFQINYVVGGRKNVKDYNWNTDVGARYWMVSKE
jgi:peptide/nickel transport system substrate-binding protein